MGRLTILGFFSIGICVILTAFPTLKLFSMTTSGDLSLLTGWNVTELEPDNRPDLATLPGPGTTALDLVCTGVMLIPDLLVTWPPPTLVLGTWALGEATLLTLDLV